MIGKTLLDIKIIGGRFIKYPAEGISNIQQSFPLQIQEVNCKGKFIYWILDKEWSVWNTLGMTGEWSYHRGKHCALQFQIDDTSIYFNDPRHFGTMKFVRGEELLQKKLKSIGPDMLGNPPNIADFKKILMKRGNKTLAESLMDQKIISGVGNYVKAESLYKAKLSPWRKSGSLLDEEINLLHQSLIQVLKEAYSYGGTTLRNYKNVNGQSGTYSDQLKIYGRIKSPEGYEIKKEETPDKRATWWCPLVQI